LLLDLDELAALALALLVRLFARLFPLFARLLGLDHVHAHLAEHGQHVLDLLGIDLLGGQYRVDLVMGDVAALLGGADELFDRGVGKVEQRQRRIGRVGRLFFGRLLFFFLFFRAVLVLPPSTSPRRPPPFGPVTPPPPPWGRRVAGPRGAPPPPHPELPRFGPAECHRSRLSPD